VTDLAEQLRGGIEDARHRADLAERAPELERELAFTKAGVPLDKPYGRLFAEHYHGRLDVDDITVSWYRQMLDREPPADVLERIADREADERIARYHQVLEEETEEDAH